MRGVPECFGVPVVTNSCAFYHAHEAAGAASIRLSLRPLHREAANSSITRAHRAARSRACVVMQRHCLRQTRSVCARERKRRSNLLSRNGSGIASWSLLSGTRSRDPLARNDGIDSASCLTIRSELGGDNAQGYFKPQPARLPACRTPHRRVFRRLRRNAGTRHRTSRPSERQARGS